MKRKAAFLLAVVLIVSTGLMAYATGSDNGIPTGLITGGSTAQSEGAETQEEAGTEVIWQSENQQETEGTDHILGSDDDGAEISGAEGGQNSEGVEGSSASSEAQGSGNAEEVFGTQASESAEQSSGTQNPESTEGVSGTQNPESTEGASGTQDSENAEGTSGTQNPESTEGASGTQDSGNIEEPLETPLPGGEEGSSASSETQDPEEGQETPGAGDVQGSEDAGDGTEEELPDQDGELDLDGNHGKLPMPGVMGQVDVSIGAALVLEQSVEFQISLAKADGENRSAIQSKTLTLGGDSTGESRVSFEDLADGTYTLTVTADKFADYSQHIDVHDKTYTVNLATGFLGGVPYADGQAHPGVLVIGDVNGDGRADDADRAGLVSAIDMVTRGIGAGLNYDLNGDGIVNLVDLEYFAKAYNDSRDKQAGVEISVSSAVIVPSGSENTAVEGDLEALLKHSAGVILKPVEGGAISEENSVALQFDFADIGEAVKTDGIIIETGSDDQISDAVISIEYVDENGTHGMFEYPVVRTAEGDIHFLLEDSSVRAERDSEGNILLHLGGQVAVKRVTLTIKGMLKNNNLVEISKVEFVNGMETRIPEPEMDIPENLDVIAGDKKISMKWDPCVNVTGYEILIRQGDQEKSKIVATNSAVITSFGGKELKNMQDYWVKVQAVNGNWRSGYGDEIKVTPMPGGRPEKPDNVKAVGQYKSVAVSWKKMDDTKYYNLFYKESSASEYQKVEHLEANSYVINNLEDLTSYTVYVTGVNDMGESGPSLSAVATTTDLNPAVMPKYKMINTGESGEKGAHIVKATMFSTMKDSPLDTESGTAWGTVDHDPASYYYKGSWDDGGYNPVGGGLNSKNGLKYEFDEAYMMDRFTFYDLTSRDTGLSYVKVRYWDEEGLAYNLSGVSFQRKTDADGRIYYQVKFPQAVKAKQLQFGLARYSASGTITVAEVCFYHYDTAYDDIMALYEDDLHTVLKPEVTQETIDALRVRINTPDEVSGELHPDLAMLERELQTAEKILRDGHLGESVKIHNTITTNDVSRGFGGLNAWQPLGVTAAAEDKIVVYVGHNTKKTGDSTNLQLVATQYNSEAGAMSKVVGTLKVGANEITIPKIWSLDYESGGALYVQYTGKNANDRYAVRVSGGVQVPILDLYQVTDESERLARATAYVEKLGAYVSELEANHKKYHQESSNKLISKYEYDAQTCILGATDIMSDTMMLSLPAAQVWAGSGSSGATIESRAQKILKSMESMEDMMYLFYQHKGLNKNASDAKDQIPAGHQNIRYQRMFAKAFMYASGNHIGIGWGSASGMVSSSSVVFDEEGRWQSGSYFGWGIAHEIGHCINQGAYSIAEITNNYFSVLAQAKETNDSVRFQYKNVYKKVTSGAKGRDGNVFTQLGMYWQLHLAYDNGYNFKTYEDPKEQLANLFFARVDAYARNTKNAPAPGEVALTLAGNKDQDLMRLACAAAERNILEFFERWGMTPDAGTLSYAEQFQTETRAIYYDNDEARVYRLENRDKGSLLATAGAVGAVSDAVTAALVEANRVDIALSSKNISTEDILGYEIVRCMISGGEVERQPVGFVTGSTGTFSDVITTINNRTVYYEVTLIDKYLNRSAKKVLDQIKIEHGGILDKSSWTVSTHNLAVEGESEDGSSNSLLYCDPENEDNATEKDKLVDNRTETVYTAAAAGTSEIILNFNKKLTVAGFKVTGGTGFNGTYEIDVCCDGIWRTAAEGIFGNENVQTIHFVNSDGKYVSTYEATAAKLILHTETGTRVSIAELDVLGVTGDNVDFRRTADDGRVVVIGRLAEEFKFGGNDGDVIPKGSIVFAGSYKGNAAYNVVILYDQDGNIVGRVSEDEVSADQIILSDVPQEGNILNVTDGIWIYWVSPEADLTGITKVRAELYRVNKAETNEGQRLVSDSLFEKMPETLPEVRLDDAAEPWK